MTMKRMLLLGAAMAATFMSVGNVQAQSKKTADELRIYINPGHGSWGPNDRPCATIPYPALETGRPDTLGFYETNTNLWKCLELGSTLERMGVKGENIIFSRRKNGPYPYVKGAADEDKYNRSLSEICEEVDANNMDMFISIHSNAASEGSNTNYPVYIYRGTDTEDYAPGSKAMATSNWKHHWESVLDPQSYYGIDKPNVRGDISFYGSSSTRHGTKGDYTGYLGVLKHGVPGFLLEGFFHTYQPSRHRALNQDWCRQEGIRVARGVCEYFGLKPETKGYIMGTVKDLHEKIVNNLYHYAPKTDDQWLPINGAKVNLLKDGTVVKTYQVDDNYNGIFVFNDLQPGKYTFQVEKEGYKPLFGDDDITVEVKANETSYAQLHVEATNYEPPVVLYHNYDEPALDGMTLAPTQLEFAQESATLTLEGTVKRMLVRGDSTVVLTNDAKTPHLYLIRNKTRTIEKELSVEGLAEGNADDLGFYSSLNDIAFTADGKLVGINSVRTQFDDTKVEDGYKRGQLNVYIWNSFDEAPKTWFTTQHSCNFYRADMGQGLTVNGASDDCQVVTTGITSGSSKALRFLIMTVAEGKLSTTSFRGSSKGQTFGEKCQGADMQLMVSPRTDDNFVIDGEVGLPLEFTMTEGAAASDAEVVSKCGDAVDAAAHGIQFFKYAGHQFMVTPFLQDEKVGGVRLFDITEGLNKATLVKSETTTLADADATTTMAAGANATTKGISLYLLHGNTFTTFTTEGVTQPVVKNIYAYDLRSVRESDNSYTLTFKANDNATDAAIIFTDAEGNEKGSKTIDVKEGENKFNISQDELPGTVGTTLNWAVRLRGEAVTQITKVYADKDAYSGFLSGNAVITTPESPYFGYIYVNYRGGKGNATNGIYAYDQTFNRVNNAPYRGYDAPSSNYRMAADPEGKVWMTEWADGPSGVYIADPAKMADEGYQYQQFFIGTRQKSGLFTNDGANVGSSAVGIAFGGTGADTKVYIANEDWTPENEVCVYNIGQEDGTLLNEWNKAPSYTLGIGNYMLNGNMHIVAGRDGGAWASQIRGSGNNSKGVPSLVYVTREGKITFNSGEGDNVELFDATGGAGFAVSNDGKMLVVNDAKGVLQFFDVTWKSETEPVLKHRGSFKSGVANTNSYIYQMNFDYAGNLICTGNRLGVFAIPTENNETITPAAAALTILKDIETGIGGVDADEADALQVRFEGNSLIIEAPETVTDVKVFAVNGALVARGHADVVDASQLGRGVYLVKVNQLPGKKVVKQ